MTNNAPFHKYNQITAMLSVLKGNRPERPKDAATIGLSDYLWQIAEDCWTEKCAERITIQAVFEQLNEITGHWVSPLPVKDNLELDGEHSLDESSRLLPTGCKFNYPKCILQSFVKAHLYELTQ